MTPPLGIERNRGAVDGAADEIAFSKLLDATLAADTARCRAPEDLASKVMHRLDFRVEAVPGRDRPCAARHGALGRVRQIAASPRGKRLVRRAGHASAIVVVILGGFMINNTLPSAVHSAPTTVPCAVEQGLERQGARIDGLMRELHRSGPAIFVPAHRSTQESPPSVPAPRGSDDHEPSGGNSNGRATAPFRWV